MEALVFRSKDEKDRKFPIKKRHMGSHNNWAPKKEAEMTSVCEEGKHFGEEAD